MVTTRNREKEMAENNLDLTLPSEVPEDPRVEHSGDGPAAVYTLVDLSDAEIEELQRVCESEYRELSSPYSLPHGTIVRKAPRPRFIGESLQSIWDYHIELRESEEETYDPFYFVVADSTDWRMRGVLVVTMSTYDNDGRPDFFYCKASNAGMAMANLQVANMGWEEVKDYDGVPGPNEDDHAHDRKPEDDNSSGSESNHPDHGPPPSKIRKRDYRIAIYVPKEMDCEKVLENLEPGATDEERTVRCPVRLSESKNPNIGSREQVHAFHPVECRKDPYLNREFALVVDRKNPETDGIAMIRLHWDGRIENRSKDTLRRIGKNASNEVQYIPYSEKAIQKWFRPIADGKRIWKASHPVFLVFRSDTDHEDLSMFHSDDLKIEPGDEWVTLAPSNIPDENGKPVEQKRNLEQAIQQFPWLCDECDDYRYRYNLIKDYFIFLESNDVDGKEGPTVSIVRVCWAPKALGDSSKVSKWRTLQVSAGEALAMIRRGLYDLKGGDLPESQRTFFGPEWDQ